MIAVDSKLVSLVLPSARLSLFSTKRPCWSLCQMGWLFCLNTPKALTSLRGQPRPPYALSVAGFHSPLGPRSCSWPTLPILQPLWPHALPWIDQICSFWLRPWYFLQVFMQDALQWDLPGPHSFTFYLSSLHSTFPFCGQYFLLSAY